MEKIRNFALAIFVGLLVLAGIGAEPEQRAGRSVKRMKKNISPLFVGTSVALGIFAVLVCLAAVPDPDVANFPNLVVQTNLTLGGVSKSAWPAGGGGVTPTDYMASVMTNGTDAATALTLLSPSASSWTEVTPGGTNAIINLAGAVPGVDRNFYWSMSTSNYVIFSNLVVGAQGTIVISSFGATNKVSWANSYNNFSTNVLGPLPYANTNQFLMAYKIGWGTDNTNVLLGIQIK